MATGNVASTPKKMTTGMTITALSVSVLSVPEAAAMPKHHPIDAATTMRQRARRIPSTRPLITPIAATQNGRRRTWAPLMFIGMTAIAAARDPTAGGPGSRPQRARGEARSSRRGRPIRGPSDDPRRGAAQAQAVPITNHARPGGRRKCHEHAEDQGRE
jgi:hypothetical protein